MKTHFFRLLFFLLFLTGFHANAQVESAMLGINGLTCSQCSRSVEMKLRRLGFVKDVQMNLERTEGKIIMEPGKKVDMELIAKAVVDAGFSVRYLQALVQFNHVPLTPGACFPYNGANYEFINTNATTLNGPVTLTFIGEQFQLKKEAKKWSAFLNKSNCAAGNMKTYFVTISQDHV